MNLKSKILLSLAFSFVFSALVSCKGVTEPDSGKASSVVEYYGLIHVKDGKVVDKNKNPVVLNGMSLFWSQWGGSFYNEKCIQWLRDDWNCTVVRAALGVENGGYLDNPQVELAKIMHVVDAAVKLGIYVVVDWHDHHAENHLDQAKAFFKTIAEKYGDKPNLIYEIYNEPLQISWSQTVKPYAVEVIKTIRQYDPDNLIVVGNPTWSQDVDVAAKDPINDSNVAYSYHFYTSTHTQSLRNKAVAAMNAGAALFITEFGISEASGDGAINYAETTNWLNFTDNYKLSACNWSVIDKAESSAALKSGASPLGGWTENDLSESGKFIRDRIRRLNASVFDALNK